MAEGIRFGKGLFGWVLFIMLSVFLFMVLGKNHKYRPDISLGDFTRLLKGDEVAWVDIGKDCVVGEFRHEQTIRDKKITEFRVPLPEGTTSNWQFTNWLMNNAGDAGVGVDSEAASQNLIVNIVVPLIPWFLIFFFIWFFVFRQLRKHTTQAREPMKVFVVNQPGAGVEPMPIPPLPETRQ